MTAGALLRIDEARRILAECVRVDEVKDIRDRAQAVATYYRERGVSLEIQNDAAEVRLRAERRLGELLAEMPKNPGTLRRGPVVPDENHGEPTLGEIGITKKQSSVWQRIAALAEDEFEERVAEAKENGLELTTSRVLRGPVPAVMKTPPEDSGVPTPKWITDPAERRRRVDALALDLLGLVSVWPHDAPTDSLRAVLLRYLDMIDRRRGGKEK